METPFYPSNGTEGLSFIDTFCANCMKDPASRGNGQGCCTILMNSMVKGIHPKQWVQEDGKARCKSFVHYKEKRITKKHRKKGFPELFSE